MLVLIRIYFESIVRSAIFVVLLDIVFIFVVLYPCECRFNKLETYYFVAGGCNITPLLINVNLLHLHIVNLVPQKSIIGQLKAN